MDTVTNFFKIEKKFTDIGFTIDGNEHFEREISELEERYSIQVAGEYRQFLLKYGGLTFDKDVCFRPIEKSIWTQKDGVQTYDYFYGLDKDNLDIREEIDNYYGRMPDSIIPIAECPGGNQLCLGVGAHNIGKIYFWDHENELEAKKMLGFDQSIQINNYWDNVFLVKESFYDFIMDLEVVESSESDGDNDDGILEFWLSDDLLGDEN